MRRFFFIFILTGAFLQSCSSHDGSHATNNNLSKYTWKDDSGKECYVINRDGTSYWDAPSENANELGSLIFGEQVKLSADSDIWAKCEYNDQQVFIKRKDLVIASDTMDQSYLYPCLNAVYNKDTLTGEKAKKIISQYLDISFISEKQYKQAKAVSQFYFLADTQNIKKNNAIVLKTHDSTSTFIDSGIEESEREYKYLGFYPFLDQYVIYTGYYEGWDFSFISRQNGKCGTLFNAFPLISPDKKHIVTILGNGYEPESTDLELFALNAGRIKRLLKVSFSYWMSPTQKFTRDIFWVNDKTLYLPITNMMVWGKPEATYQYIKIRIK